MSFYLTFFFFSRKTQVSICGPSTKVKITKTKQGPKEMGKKEDIRYFLRYLERTLSLLTSPE